MSDFEGRTGKWIIYYDPPPIPIRTCDWHFYHEDCGGPPADDRAGHGSSFADCVRQIEEMEDEEERVHLASITPQPPPGELEEDYP